MELWDDIKTWNPAPFLYSEERLRSIIIIPHLTGVGEACVPISIA